MPKMIVCKFGGTSVADCENSKKIKEIVDSNSNRRIIVVSALGKSGQYNYKVTDKLFELYQKIVNCEDYTTCAVDIFFRYEELSKQLGVKINWETHKQKYMKRLKSGKITKSYVVSRGEYYSALLYAKYLNAHFLDAADYICFNHSGKINYSLTTKRLQSLKNENLYVIGGYYGADKNGDICVFDRGGSDITGAIIAKCLNAEVYENYTDVCGVYDKNPNIFEGAKNLPVLNYKTTIQMAEAGNEVIHRDALLTLKNTPTILLIKHTNKYKDLGTIILDNKAVLDALFVCASRMVCIITKNISQELISNVKSFGDIKNIFSNQKYYYVLVNNWFKPLRTFSNLEGCTIDHVYVIRLFSNITISGKNLKNARKIAQRAKNYAFFCKFCAINNNLTIITIGKYYGIILKIINHCLQKK